MPSRQCPCARSRAARRTMVAAIVGFSLVAVGEAAQAAGLQASSSSSDGTWMPVGATDGRRFETNAPHAWRGKSGEKSWWWQVRFDKARPVGAILQIVGDDSILFHGAPRQYVWQGSLDGQSWTDLEETRTDRERRTFRIHRLAKPQTWQYLRMNIAKSEGPAPTLREVEIYDTTNSKIDFPAWIIPVSTEESQTLPFQGPEFIALVRQCAGYQDVQAQHVWLDNFDAAFVAVEPRPLCAFLSGNLAEWCQRTREPWRGTQEILRDGRLPMWASCGGAQGLAILTAVGVDKPWDCPRCRDPKHPKLPVYTHIGHTGPGKCGEYGACIFETGPTFVRQVAKDPAFEGLPAEFETMESHCGQIEYVPEGWTLVVTNGRNGKTKTQCIRINDRPIYAAQFHIEMLGTPDSSRKIMSNFLTLAKSWGGYNEHGRRLPPPLPLETK